MERIKRKNFTLILMIVSVAFLIYPGAADRPLTMTKLWPIESRNAAKEMYDRYGQPDVEGGDFLIWKKRGPWEKITVSRSGTLHKFPFEHYDVLEQTLPYKVPIEKLNEIVIFDGSLVVDRTRGTISARCDRESSNILALNLAHLVATNKMTVRSARFEYGQIIRDKKNGADPALMKQLAFIAPFNTPDPDINTTGLNGARTATTRKSWLPRLIAGQ
jgi:hypothetical protein